MKTPVYQQLKHVVVLFNLGEILEMDNTFSIYPLVERNIALPLWSDVRYRLIRLMTPIKKK